VVGPSHEIRAFTPGGLRKELDVRMIWLAVWQSWFNLRPYEAIRGSGVSMDGNVGEWKVYIRGSKVVALVCVD
jgi:hypothetical protein